MSVTEKHPDYTAARIAEWRLMEDCTEGESAVKARGDTYLTKPSGYSRAAGFPDDGAGAYAAYKGRAQFPEILSPSVGAMVGIIHDKAILIEMPDPMGYLVENVNGKGRTLEDFHKGITRELLIKGRYGVMADAPESGGEPFLCGYRALSIINWDDDFFVLDESDMVRDGFTWSRQDKYRVLELVDGVYTQQIHKDGAVEDTTPTMIGGASLDYVPFVIAGARDLGLDVETPPMIGVARAALAMYQLSADYRLQLFMSGQETLVAINGDAPKAVGAGVVHEMRGSESITPDLKYVSPACTGIDKHLEAIDHNKDSAAQAGARLFEQSQSSQESGEARQMRFKSETANLQTIAQSSCAALEYGLRGIASLLGLNADDVRVVPPKDLLDTVISPADAQALWNIAKTGGMSWATYYENLQSGGIANADRDSDEEFQLIEDQEFIGSETDLTDVDDVA